MPTFGPYGYSLNDECSLVARILTEAGPTAPVGTAYVTDPAPYLDLGPRLYVRGGVSTTASDGSPSCLNFEYVSLASRPSPYNGRIFPTNVTFSTTVGTTTSIISTELLYRLPDLTDYYPGQAAVEQCTLIKMDAIPNTLTAANYLTTTITDTIEFVPIIQPDPVIDDSQPTETPRKQPMPVVGDTTAKPGAPDITKLIPQITAILGWDGTYGDQGSPGPGEHIAPGSGSDAIVTDGAAAAPDRIIAPNTKPLTTQPAVYINGQLLSPGGTPISVDGRPLSMNPSGMSVDWGGQVIPVDELTAALVLAAAVVSSTSLLVYRGQTLLPGGPPVTVLGDNRVSQVLSMVQPDGPDSTPRLVVLSQSERPPTGIAKLIMIALEIAKATASAKPNQPISGDPLGVAWMVNAALESQRAKSPAAKLATTFLPTTTGVMMPTSGSNSEPGAGSSETTTTQGKASAASSMLGALCLTFITILMLI